MRETKYWTWHMAAGVVIFFLLGLHHADHACGWHHPPVRSVTAAQAISKRKQLVPRMAACSS